MEKTLRETVKNASLASLSNEISKYQEGKNLAIITDRNVAEFYLEECASGLRDAGFDLSYHIINPGEESKNPTLYLNILKTMAKDGLTRADGIVALGGGVVGDLAGFTAATYMRGINIYQVPTSLLAMVDSSIGGKTGIDLPEGKNLVGAFHMPSLVLQDVRLLRTLPEEEFRNGMAEVIKYAIITGGKLYDELNNPLSWDDIRTDEKGLWFLDNIVRASSDIKLSIVEEDPMDKGRRELLNLGHTLGHALETLSNYEIKHGFSVAKGIMGITNISEAMGWCSESAKADICELLESWGFDLSVDYSGSRIYEAIKVDKKRRGTDMDLIVPHAIKDCEIKRIDMEELEKCLLDEYGE